MPAKINDYKVVSGKYAEASFAKISFPENLCPRKFISAKINDYKVLQPLSGRQEIPIVVRFTCHKFALKCG